MFTSLDSTSLQYIIGSGTLIVISDINSVLMNRGDGNVSGWYETLTITDVPQDQKCMYHKTTV